MRRNALSAVSARAGKACSSSIRPSADQNDRSFASANCSICSTVVRPMPRAGVLMTRSRLMESEGLEITFKYATRSFTSARW